MSIDKAVPQRRKRGNSAGINPKRIVAAARGLDLETLTMQAVANELGVDRKAVNYHVADRERLLELLATDAFATRFKTAASIPLDSSWRDALRLIATMVKDSLIASHPLAIHFTLRGPADPVVLEQAEIVLQILTAAGLEESEAGRALALVVNNAMSFARDMVLNARYGHYQAHPEVQEALDGAAPDKFTVMRHLDRVEFTPFDEEQFEFVLGIILDGLERRIAR